MEVLAQGLVELLFGGAARAARRRRAAAFAAAHGLRFHPDGRPDDPDAAGMLDELAMLGVPFQRPIADTVAGTVQGRHVIGFENPVWDKGRRTHVAHRFTAVRLARAVPDLLVAAETPAWFAPAAPCLPVPAPEPVTATDPAYAGAVLTALEPETPLARTWTARANWVVGWHPGHLRARGKNDAAAALRFLTAAADACERTR